VVCVLFLFCSNGNFKSHINFEGTKMGHRVICSNTLSIYVIPTKILHKTYLEGRSGTFKVISAFVLAFSMCSIRFGNYHILCCFCVIVRIL
jgi:hypothetical protein